MKFQVTILFTFLCATLCAQEISLRGQVLDSLERGIHAANILLLDGSSKEVKGTLTSVEGSFYFEKLTPGSCTLAISAMGYISANVPLGLQKDTAVRIVLYPSATSLREVVVTAAKRPFEMKPDKMVMNVEGNALAIGNSVFEVIRKGPAITVDKDDNLLMKGIAAAIFINGKPSFLSGEQLTEYLKNLPAESIAAIEFITNPGSKYPAEGTGGIINIRLKKNTLYGTNGQVSTGVGYGRYPKYRASADLNYRSQALNLFGGSSLSYSKSYNELTYNSTIVNGSETSFQDRSNYWNPRTRWHSYKAGLDYNIGRRSLLGAVLNLDTERDTVVTTNISKFSNDQKRLQQQIGSLKKEREGLHSLSANLNFKRSTDASGSGWTADADYSYYNRKEHSLNENVFRAPDGSRLRKDFVFFNQQPAQIRLLSLKADYTKVWKGGGRLELGGKWSSVQTDNNLVSDTLAFRGWERDYTVSNHFILEETIAAGYATYSDTWKELDYQVGLRAEHTATNGNSKTYDKVTRRQYLDFFPTVFLKKSLGAHHDLSFSYARRISRPGYSSLNPFVNYIDPYTRFEGNALLNAAYSNSWELKHDFKQWLFTSLSYNRVADNIIRTILQDNQTKVIVNKTQNAGKLSAFRLDIMATKTYRWWSASTNMGLGYSHGASTLPGYSYDTRSFSGDFSMNHSFTLPGNVKLLLDGSYSLPEKSGLAHLESSFAVNIGAQKSFWNKKATVRLNGTTVIGQHQYRAHYKGSGLDIRWVNEWEGRRVNLNVSYKFGNQKVKAARQKADALEGEKGRISF